MVSRHLHFQSFDRLFKRRKILASQLSFIVEVHDSLTSMHSSKVGGSSDEEGPMHESYAIFQRHMPCRPAWLHPGHRCNGGVPCPEAFQVSAQKQHYEKPLVLSYSLPSVRHNKPAATLVLSPNSSRTS